VSLSWPSPRRAEGGRRSLIAGKWDGHRGRRQRCGSSGTGIFRVLPLPSFRPRRRTRDHGARRRGADVRGGRLPRQTSRNLLVGKDSPRRRGGDAAGRAPGMMQGIDGASRRSSSATTRAPQPGRRPRPPPFSSAEPRRREAERPTPSPKAHGARRCRIRRALLAVLGRSGGGQGRQSHGGRVGARC